MRRKCPDGGTCHHRCYDDDVCWRVESCAPLSSYGEKWNLRAADRRKVDRRTRWDGEISDRLGWTGEAYPNEWRIRERRA